MTVDNRFLINPEGQTDDEIVDFIMGILEESGELSEARLVEHPGHPDQKVHGRKGGGTVSTTDQSKGVAEPITAANAVLAGGTANVAKDDLDEALIHMAESGKPGANLMGLTVDGKMVTGDHGLPTPRNEMPQFDGDNKTQFIQELEASGVRVTRRSVDPATLTPGQNEIDAWKTGGMFRDIHNATRPDTGGDPIITSREGRIVDGNHRGASYMAARSDGHPDIKINVIEVDMPAGQLIPFAQSWTASHGIANRALGT